MDGPAVAELLKSRRPGFTLPGAFYTDEAIHELDLRAIFRRKWISAGFDAEIPNAGDYFSFSIGRTPVMLIRTTEGEVKGLFNTCRHRGSQILPEGHGNCRALVCPYHQWSYSLEGKLRAARGMGRDFDKDAYSLASFAVESIGGTLYICLSESPPDIAPFRSAFEPLISRYRLKEGKVVHHQRLIEKANWKLAMENARECFHCQVGHPELLRPFINSILLDFANTSDEHLAGFVSKLRSHDIPVGPTGGEWFSTAHVPLKPGYQSMTMNGDHAVRKPLAPGLDGLGVLRWHIQPNCYNLAMPDYAFSFSALPISAGETLVHSKWLVHKDAVPEIDYDPAYLQHLLSVTNQQDIALTEANQRGVNSVAYRPGPYVPQDESWCLDFADWYCREMQSYIGESGTA